MKWIAPAGRIARHHVARLFNKPTPIPVALTVSVTHRCNLECITCRVALRQGTEMTTDQMSRVARSIGAPLFWITFSGGEPFLRNDLSEIVQSFYRWCRPSVINIPTNGTIPGTVECVRDISTACPDTTLVINVSLDETGERHDRLRGRNGVFDRAAHTFRRLRSHRLENVKLGIHTVLSTCNTSRLEQIIPDLRKFDPDQYIAEVAEERWELRNVPLSVKPSAKDFFGAYPVLIRDLKQHSGRGFSRLSASLRICYYNLVKKHLVRGIRVVPCHAGRVSAHIDADGTVWTCCVAGTDMGRLSDTGFDFRILWNGPEAREARRTVDLKRCACPLANAMFTNMLMRPASLARVAGTWLRLGDQAGRSIK